MAMSELFLIAGLMAASAAAMWVLNSSVGKKGGIPSASGPVVYRCLSDDY